MLFGGPWARPSPPYFVQYLHPIGFFFFSLFSSHPLLMWLCALRDVLLFLLGGGVIGTWTGRGNGECITFLFLFVCVIPFVVLGLLCTWLWWRVRSPHCSPTGIVGGSAVAVPTVAAWLSLY